MKSTQEADQINTQLNNSNQGLTIFAPPDNAFANLKAGTLNSLSDQEKVQLVQFHILPSFISMSQFQTVSNPLRTQAGNSANGEFPLNVTTSGNQVNVTTGVNTATVANTIYTDGQLAVYQVDQVLLPLDLFAAPTAPAPAPSKLDKVIPAKTPATTSDDTPADASDATTTRVSFAGNGRATMPLHCPTQTTKTETSMALSGSNRSIVAYDFSIFLYGIQADNICQLQISEPRNFVAVK
ncbi:hypothetical protein GH714_039242 [Hevea brasiliensis]|uniref:FAS1 domain-containing protein n=1 Tax=Hevea brasiliensis TaxID=3981 RepID=A0A6A6KLV8_HEVBR|nr:hypothetical protein GH714_039242 [Hevea brasiliensis]